MGPAANGITKPGALANDEPFVLPTQVEELLSEAWGRCRASGRRREPIGFETDALELAGTLGVRCIEQVGADFREIDPPATP